MSAPAPSASATSLLRFGGLDLASGPGVIRPRPWTVAQSAWAAELAPGLPPGPILELCAGCGVIGLEAARRSGRPIVLVDASAEACRWAEHNAATNGLRDRVEVRQRAGSCPEGAHRLLGHTARTAAQHLP